jgi:hypothetical protein
VDCVRLIRRTSHGRHTDPERNLRDVETPPEQAEIVRRLNRASATKCRRHCVSLCVAYPVGYASWVSMASSPRNWRTRNPIIRTLAALNSTPAAKAGA